MNTETIETPDVPVVEKPRIPHDVIEIVMYTNSELVRLQSRQIENDDEYQQAGEQLKLVSEKIRQLESRKREVLAPLNEAITNLRSWFKGPEEKLTALKQLLNKQVGLYDDKLRKQREEAERRAREEAERIAAEERKKAEELARQAEEKRKAAEEEAARVEKENGDKELAEAIREQAENDAGKLEEQASEAHTVAELSNGSLPTIDQPKLKGVSFRETWSAEITDLEALAGAVSGGVIDSDAILPNTKYLNQLARAMKTKLNIPGVRAVCKKSVAS